MIKKIIMVVIVLFTLVNINLYSKDMEYKEDVEKEDYYQVEDYDMESEDDANQVEFEVKNRKLIKKLEKKVDKLIEKYNKIIDSVVLELTDLNTKVSKIDTDYEALKSEIRNLIEEVEKNNLENKKYDKADYVENEAKISDLNDDILNDDKLYIYVDENDKKCEIISFNIMKSYSTITVISEDRKRLIKCYVIKGKVKKAFELTIKEDVIKIDKVKQVK